MTRVSVNPGRVEWSGESARILLKEFTEGDYSAAAIVFRIALSPHGQGQLAIVLGSPDEPSGWPNIPNFVLTDNQRLAGWLIDGWVRKYPEFANRRALDHARWLALDSVARRPAFASSRYTKILNGPGIALELAWENLERPFSLELSSGNSPTGRHESYSVVQEARSARISINGTNLAGQTGKCGFFDRNMHSSYLSFSETWVSRQLEKI